VRRTLPAGTAARGRAGPATSRRGPLPVRPRPGLVITVTVNRRHFVTTAALAPALLPSASSAATAAAPTAAPGAEPVRTGADVLAAQGWRALRGDRVGVLTNPTGVLSSLRHVVDAMHEQGAPVVA